MKKSVPLSGGIRSTGMRQHKRIRFHFCSEGAVLVEKNPEQPRVQSVAPGEAVCGSQPFGDSVSHLYAELVELKNVRRRFLTLCAHRLPEISVRDVDEPSSSDRGDD